MKMKRFFAILLTLLLTINTVGLTAFAEQTQAKTADVYVTIADGEGELALVQEKITVTDIDNDGTLTIDEALYAAHEAKYEGGAAGGYSSYVHPDYGLSLETLWGNDSGNFGYYVNNASAWSLADEVKTGDYINAFVYTDAAWGDTYCYFDKNIVETKAETEVTLTLFYAGYDAEWNPVALPVANATITVDGVATEYKTDAEGKVTLKIAEAGTYVISATSDTQILVPPVCKLNVEVTDTTTGTDTDTTTDTNTNQPGQASPKTGDSFNTGVFMMLGVVSCACVILSLGKRKNAYEK